MNKRIDLTKLGGYPLAQEDLDWLQTSYRGAFAAMAVFIGDKVILSGMIEAGGNVTAGWISIGGELMPFLAGTIGTGEFIVDDQQTSLIFDDGETKPVLFEKVARFSAGGANLYADLKRLGTLKQIWQRGDIKEVDCDEAYIVANFDVTGLGKNERIGWAICNGANGTRDRGGRLSVGLKVADTDFNLMGKTAGEKTHILTANEQGTVKWRVQADDGDSSTGGFKSLQSLDINGDSVTASSLGSNGWSAYKLSKLQNDAAAHNVMQPYIVSLHIMKL